MKRYFSRQSAFAAVAALVLGVAAWSEDSSAQDKKVVPAANVERAALDEPLAMLAEAKRNYTAVKDYTCTLVTQERVKGRLEEQNIIQMKMKTEPFSVYMRWIAPKKSVNQEVAFIAGKNNNKMRVKSPNILKVLGWINVDLADPRVMEHSRHTILEAGLGNMIEQNIRHWESARKAGNTKATMSEAKYNDRDCLCVEVVAKDKTGNPYCHTSVLYLEKKSKLPIRLENYDWPREGATRGDLLESFSYVNLQFNVGLKDEEFSK